MNNLIPVALNSAKLNVLIIGLGRVGRRKFQKYQSAGATVSTVDPEVDSADYVMDFSSYFKQFESHFKAQHLVIICTNQPKTNQEIALICDGFAKLYNRTDKGVTGLFTDMISLVDEHAVVGISSLHQSPYISKHLSIKIKPTLECDQTKRELDWLCDQTEASKKNLETYENVMMRWRQLHES